MYNDHRPNAQADLDPKVLAMGEKEIIQHISDMVAQYIHKFEFHHYNLSADALWYLEDAVKKQPGDGWQLQGHREKGYWGGHLTGYVKGVTPVMKVEDITRLIVYSKVLTKKCQEQLR